MGRPRTKDHDLQPGWRRINGRLYFAPTTQGERDARRRRSFELPDGPLVYFIRSKAGPVKIGHTTKANLERRLAALRVGSAAELAVLGVVPGTHDDEQRAHKQLHLYRRAGEWFGPSRAVTAYVRQAIIDGRIPD